MEHPTMHTMHTMEKTPNAPGRTAIRRGIWRRRRDWARLAVVALLALPAAAGESSWTLAKQADGIEVYTREVAGSVFKESRATAVVPAPLGEVVAWWQDPSTFPEWIDSCAEARQLNEDTGYMKFDFPFPASDRDVVVRARRVEETATNAVFETENVDGVLPEVPGLVRIAMLQSRWEFHAEGDAATQVVYSQHMDAGGSLPAFILNRAAVDNPFGTLRGLIHFAEANRSR